MRNGSHGAAHLCRGRLAALAGLLTLLNIGPGAPASPDPPPADRPHSAGRPEASSAGAESPSPPPAQVRFVSPLPGRVVFGPTRAEVSVLPSDAPVERVVFILDGVARAEDREPPYVFEWDAGYEFLSQRLEAVAYLAGGEPARAVLETARVALRERVKVEAEPQDLVEIAFVVTDRDRRPVRGLRREEFRLKVDGKETALLALAEERRRRGQPLSVALSLDAGRDTHEFERERPLSVALLLDVSRSMRDLERERFLLAAQALLDRLRPGDEMLILTFSTDYQVLSDFTHDPRALRAALEQVPRPDRGTDLYGALEEALDRLSERTGRRVVILYSDGQATVGRSSLTATPASLDVLDQTRREPIVLYWIVPHFQDATIVQRTPALRNLAAGSGGRWILESEGIEKILDEIGQELQSQYYASFFVDKTEHRRPYYEIDLQARDPGLRVQAPSLVSGSGSLVKRLKEMLESDATEERLAAAVQMPRYGYPEVYFPLLRGYRREKDPGVRDALLAALLAVLRDEWTALAERDGESRASARRHLERQIRRLDDPRALALLDTLR